MVVHGAGLVCMIVFRSQLDRGKVRGIRAPHKLKGGVSGCIRECAEAKAKDFGIIATEKGWNLYVCGNGGSKPQHAYCWLLMWTVKPVLNIIDRFLMFYIKTADPLTRTATWLNKMEGGIRISEKCSGQ